MSHDISIIIHTFNEEENIRECIQSARQLSDRIVVIDMGSRDKTREYVLREGCVFYDFPYTKYVEPARRFGIAKAQTEWVFILDADERITQPLADEIKSLLHLSTHSHYKVPRKNIFSKKKWLVHGGWYPDYQVRLINKKYFVSWPSRIHAVPHIRGTCGLLRNPLVHYFHPSFENMVQKTVTFEDIESDLLFEAGKKVSTVTFLRKFGGELYKRLVVHKGFLDGAFGIIESIYQAFSKTITYIFLYEKYEKEKDHRVRSVS